MARCRSLGSRTVQTTIIFDFMQAETTSFFMTLDNDQDHLYQIQDYFQDLTIENSITVISIHGLHDIIQKLSNQEQIELQFIDKLCQTHLYWKCAEFSISYCMKSAINSMKVISKLSNSCRFLIELQLDHNHLGDQGAQAIAKAHWKFINYLSLEDTHLTHNGVKILSSHQWKFLRFLNVSKNKLTNRGLLCLVQTNAWRNLRTLLISSIDLTPDGIKLLRKGCWQRLCSLTIGRYEGSSEVLKTISQSGLNELKYAYFQSKGYCYPGFEAKIKSHVDFDGVTFRCIPLLIYHNESRLFNEQLSQQLKMKKLVLVA